MIVLWKIVGVLTCIGMFCSGIVKAAISSFNLGLIDMATGLVALLLCFSVSFVLSKLDGIHDAVVSNPAKPYRIQQTDAHPAATTAPVSAPAGNYWTCRSCGYDKNTSMAKECKSCGKAR